MALLELNYRSSALRMNVTVNVILPNPSHLMKEDAEPYKTLYLFHGLSDDHSAWLRYSCIERYATERGIAVVMPSVGRFWYTDTVTSGPYLTFVTEELPRVCRSYFKGISDKREDTMVAGLSMGGYGAVKAALTHPDVFSACATLSGALDIVSFGERPDVINEWRGIFGLELTNTAQMEGGPHDLLHLLRSAKEKKDPLPRMFVWCGEDDFLLEQNRHFRAVLNELEIPHYYAESEGNHSWKWWDLHIQDALDYMLDQNQ